MAGPRFDDIPGEEERRKPAAPRFDQLEGEVEEAPGALESFARGAGQGVSLGFGDELAGAAGAVGTAWGRAGRRLLDGKLLPDSLEAEVDAVGRGYRKARDEVRAENADAERSNGGAYLAGQIGGGAATGIATGGLGHGLKGALATGAAEGAVSGFGGSGSDLTKQDVKEYARAAGDALKGGGLGLVGGGVGYGIGKGVRAAGRWGKDVLDRARGSLRASAEAVQEAEERAAAEAAQEAEVRMGKAHAQGLEMNAKLDRKKAQEAGRKAMQEARAAREGRTEVDPRLRELDRMNKEHGQALEMNKRAAARARARADAEADARTQADPRVRAQDAAAREAEKAAGARTQVDQRLRAQDRENIQAARAAENQARQEAQAAQRRAEQLEKAQGQALQKNKELDAARAKRAAKEARQAQREAEARAAKAQRQAEALEKQHGVGLEMNKRQQRGVRVSEPLSAPPEARGPRGRGEPKPDVDPETKVVQGYRDQAVGARLTNEQRVELYRQRLAGSEGSPDQRELWQRYVDKYGSAVDNPHQYVRDTIDRNMRLAKYPPGVVERVLRDRIGPKGQVYRRTGELVDEAARGPRAPASEATQAMDLGDAVKQGRGEELRRAGGGGSAFEDAPAGQRTIVDMPLSQPAPRVPSAQPPPDPFHDAPTKVAAIETTPDRADLHAEYDRLLRRADEGRITPDEEIRANEIEDELAERVFEVRDKKSGRLIEIKARESENGDVWVESILPADRDVINREMWNEEANKVGPSALKQALPDIAKAFPDARMIGGKRVTGTRRGKNFDRPARQTWAPLPEVTQSMDASDLEAIAAKSENPALRRQREKGFGSQNMGAARFGEETIAYPNDDILRSQANRGGEVTQVGAPPQGTVTRAVEAAEARGGEDLRKAFVRGAAGPDAAALGLGGIAVGGLAGGAGGVAARGGAEVVKELARNPAARARAVTLFRLERLASTRPEVYARVGGVLARALEKGPEHYAAKRHVLLLTNPELRQAEAEADEELQGLSDEELAARVARTR